MSLTYMSFTFYCWLSWYFCEGLFVFSTSVNVDSSVLSINYFKMIVFDWAPAYSVEFIFIRLKNNLVVLCIFTKSTHPHLELGMAQEKLEINIRCHQVLNILAILRYIIVLFMRPSRQEDHLLNQKDHKTVAQTHRRRVRVKRSKRTHFQGR